ncbi:MAG TPA: hypothetical protein PLX60_10140 [Chitinophagales bacterium]|jgi:hypothetical protein|nr:hypothetical protein [Chitinophagales bacterium]
MRHLKNKKRKEIEEYYKNFVANIPNYIVKLKSILKKDAFNYSFDEISEVEKFYEFNFNKPSNFNLSKEELDNIVASYLGTAFMWHFGGNWCLDLDKKSTSYGLAMLENYGGKDYDWIYVTPFSWIWYIESNQLENESIAQMFERWIVYHKKNPQFIIEPVRNIQ